MSARIPGRDFPTGDDPVTCNLCGKETSLAMIVSHLAFEHSVDPDDIADAPVYGPDDEDTA